MPLTSTARTRIAWHYGCDTLAEVHDSDSVDVYDSIQEGFCTECGAYYGNVEPDARYDCAECGAAGTAEPISEIIMTHQLV